MDEEFIKALSKKLDSYDIDELYKNGIIKERFLKNFSSQIVVTYPPISVLPKIGANKIFKKPNNKDFTLYLHIPFCTGKCLYCGFSTYANQKSDRVDEYLAALKQEMQLYLSQPQIRRAKIKSVYIGGGTPTFLSESQLQDLLNFVTSNFKILRGAEFTVESSPETVSLEKLKILIGYGANRLNIGVQTFNDEALKLILRRHSSEQAVESYKLARRAGFRNINIDLMRGLPDENIEDMVENLAVIKKLKPESVTFYDLIIKPSAGIKILYTKEPGRFLSTRDQLLVHLCVMDALKKMGYKQNPIDWFYIKSKVYKQQIQKWEDMINALSFGVSAYSYVNNVQYVNVGSLESYLNYIKAGKLPIECGEELTKEEQLNRVFVFGIKTKINKQRIKKEFGEIPGRIKTKLKKLKSLGLIEEKGETIKLSQKGALFANEICVDFYSDKIKNRIG